MSIFTWLQHRLYKAKKILCSIWKYFKYMKNQSDQLLEATKSPGKIINLMDELIEIAPKILILEKKKGKLSLNHAITVLA
ncbi:hypothetical protein C9994_12140 [Marivirga lumbricoides]|uniref:Uncharacterized protein n=1 Tax=Marivirga lumbricoides TaxID=1046115 RepID=A0A2T4DKS7_9BACT|nr:hypothetical protein C9994_12140 [Marivirga lumbricoides]